MTRFPSLRAFTNYTLGLLPTFLFLILGTGLGLHWWHGKLRVYESKCHNVGYIYTVFSPHYALIAIWGIGVAAGRSWPPVLSAALTLSLVSLLINTWLKLLRKRNTDKPKA